MGVVKSDLRLLERLTSLLAPDYCGICSSEGSPLCRNCFELSFPETSSRCYMCNKLSNDDKVCKSCSSSSRLRRVWWLGQYESTLKDLVGQMKYRRKRSNARTLAEYLAERVPYLPENTLVIPVSTATSRVRLRGFDQAVLIAKRFAKLRQLPLVSRLLRTGQQELIGKSRIQRRHIMERSFIWHGPEIKHKNVLLIDDVLTTGATIEAAATLVRNQGAKHVDAAVLARRLLN